MTDFTTWTLIVVGFTAAGNVIELLATIADWMFFSSFKGKMTFDKDAFIWINAMGFGVWLILIFWLMVVPRTM